MTLSKRSCNVLTAGSFVVVVGAGGGLGQYAVQYAQARGARVLGIDTGAQKRQLVEDFGAHFVDVSQYIAERSLSCADVQTVQRVRGHRERGSNPYQGRCGLCHRISRLLWSFCTGSVDAEDRRDYVYAKADQPKAISTQTLTLALAGCIGIPPGGGQILTSVAEIVIKGLKIKGNLVGNLKECLEAVEQVRVGLVKPRVLVRPFKDLAAVYEELEKGDIAGRVVLKIGEDPASDVVA